MNTAKLNLLGEFVFCSMLAVCLLIAALIAFIKLIEGDTECGIPCSMPGPHTSLYYSEPFISEEESQPG